MGNESILTPICRAWHGKIAPAGSKAANAERNPKRSERPEARVCENGVRPES